jgi:hypothetical protein
MKDSTIQKELYQCIDKAMSIVSNQAINDVASGILPFDTLAEFEDFMSEEYIAEDLYKILYKFYKKQYRYYRMTN